MEIKAILIDIDNTLLDFDKSANKASYNTAEKYGITLPDNYNEIFHRVNDELWTSLQCGDIEKPDIYKMRFRKIFDILGIDADSDSFEEDFRKEMREIAELVEGAEEILKYLSAKYPVYTASNASRFQQEVRLKKSGLWQYLSGMFTSEEIGFQKPAKEFFTFCHKQLSPLSESEIIMIGDSISADITGAKNYGINTIWFNFKGETIDNYGFTDYYVNSLYEIKDIL